MLKNLKSLFFVEDEPEDDKSKKGESAGENKDAKPEGVQKTNQSAPVKSTNTGYTNGKVNNKIIEKLLDAIDKSNMEGFDYLEYKRSLEALAKMPMDEATRYRSAFATAATLGVTLDKLVSSTNYYLTVLNNESDQFSTTFKNEFTSQVVEKEKEIKQFENIIKEKADRIKVLTDEITKHQVQMEDMRVKIDEGKAKIDKTRTDFKVSFEHVKSMFQEDIDKMKKYLK